MPLQEEQNYHDIPFFFGNEILHYLPQLHFKWGKCTLIERVTTMCGVWRNANTIIPLAAAIWITSEQKCDDCPFRSSNSGLHSEVNTQ